MKSFFILLLLFCFHVRVFSQISFYTKEINDSSDSPKKYYLQVAYPVLKGFTDDEIQKNINNKIASYIKTCMEEFNKDLNEWELPNTEMHNIASGFYITYEAVHTNNVFSLIFYSDHYFAGTAHPSHDSHTMNFDLSNGNLINFNELFDKNNNYLENISKYCIHYLKNKNEDMPYDEDWIKEGAGPKDENFKSFNIKPECLLITFDPYQVAAYAVGYQSVEIPYKDIKDIVNKEGPLKEFYK